MDEESSRGTWGRKLMYQGKIDSLSLFDKKRSRHYLELDDYYDSVEIKEEIVEEEEE